MDEIRITFSDVPGAAIVGDEEAVNSLLVKLTAGMDVAQLNQLNETPLTDEEICELWQYIRGLTSWEIMIMCDGNVNFRQLLEQRRRASSHYIPTR